MMPRSVLSKMDGEEGRCNAVWVLSAIAWNAGTTPRLGAKRGKSLQKFHVTSSLATLTPMIRNKLTRNTE